MMVKSSGLGKIFLKFLLVLPMSFFLLLNFDQKYKFSNKNNMVSAWRNFKNIFPKAKLLLEATFFHSHFYLPEIIYQSKMAMEYCTVV